MSCETFYQFVNKIASRKKTIPVLDSNYDEVIVSFNQGYSYRGHLYLTKNLNPKDIRKILEKKYKKHSMDQLQFYSESFEKIEGLTTTYTNTRWGLQCRFGGVLMWWKDE